MKYGIYGGGFNPPHVAHVLSVAQALVMHGLERIFVSPCWHHAFDKDEDLISWEHRAQMCGLAFEAFPQVRIPTWEVSWKPTYTVDLLEKVLPSLEPHGKPHLIIGSDNYQFRKEWERWDDIVALLKGRDGGVIVLPRPGYPTKGSSLAPKLPDISSTHVRAAVERGAVGDLYSWVPARVIDYIVRHKLYGYQA